MASHLSVIRMTAVLGLVVAGAMWPECASAQLGRRSTERLLILNPITGPGFDSTVSPAVGDALRDRVANKYRMQFSVIPGTTVCEALEASGFQCTAPLPPENAPALARFLQATGFIVSWLDHTSGDSLKLTLRMVDAAGSGLSGWQSFTAPAATSAEDLGKLAADGLDDRVKAAQYARECSERRGRGDAKGAVDRASKAFAMFPDYPSAWQCVAYAYEVEKQPVDSIVRALQHAAKGDSLNGAIWRDLGRRLREAGDTAASWEAFRNQLRAEPTDGALRLGVAQGLMSQGKHQEAIDVLDEGLAMNPGDMPTLQLKERICLEGSLWKCGLSALEQEYDLDTALAGDTAFIQKAFGTAQSIPDTAAMLKWSNLGTDRFPDALWAWRARAAALKLAPDRRDETIAAYQHIVQLDSTQIASALAIAQYLFDSTLVIDTTVPLDTARLMRGERLIELVARQSQNDTSTMQALAGMLYGPAAKIAQKRMVPYLPIAAQFLKQALRYDLRGTLSTTLNFFLGLADAFQVFDGLEALDKSKSCDLLQQKIDLTDEAVAAFTIGKSVSPPTTDQLLPYLTKLKGDLPKYKAAWKCPS